MTRPFDPATARYRLHTAAVLAGLFLTTVLPSQAARAADCAQMAKLVLPKTTITSVETVAANTFTVTGRLEPSGMNVAGHPLQNGENPAFCRIKATIKPGPESEVKSEIWLPLSGWNGRFLHIGSFGWGGTINTAALLTGVQQGYATANNDTGHDAAGPDGGGGKFAMGPADRMLDYAGRANHEMAIATKSMIKAFYGKAQSYSYLVGCSLGGLQGLIAAKKYPADYDGIVAGARCRACEGCRVPSRGRCQSASRRNAQLSGRVPRARGQDSLLDPGVRRPEGFLRRQRRHRRWTRDPCLNRRHRRGRLVQRRCAPSRG